MKRYINLIWKGQQKCWIKIQDHSHSYADRSWNILHNPHMRQESSLQKFEEPKKFLWFAKKE